jgi:hypothetical protein
MDYHYQQLGSGLPDRDGACFIGGMVWSETVAAKGSPNTVDASSNDTPCFLKFASALRGSHSKRTATCYREGTFNGMSAGHWASPARAPILTADGAGLHLAATGDKLRASNMLNARLLPLLGGSSLLEPEADPLPACAAECGETMHGPLEQASLLEVLSPGIVRPVHDGRAAK